MKKNYPSKKRKHSSKRKSKTNTFMLPSRTFARVSDLSHTIPPMIDSHIFSFSTVTNMLTGEVLCQEYRETVNGEETKRERTTP